MIDLLRKLRVLLLKRPKIEVQKKKTNSILLLSPIQHVLRKKKTNYILLLSPLQHVLQKKKKFVPPKIDVPKTKIEVPSYWILRVLLRVPLLTSIQIVQPTIEVWHKKKIEVSSNPVIVRPTIEVRKKKKFQIKSSNFKLRILLLLTINSSKTGKRTNAPVPC